MMTKPRIHIIKMGGTIEFFDPSYDELIKRLMQLDTSIENYLNHVIQPHFQYTSETIAQKDSRDLAKGDRDSLVEAITNCEAKDIIVTHGTFTMLQTAQYIEQYLNSELLSSKKIILTGSMIPITGFTMSDAGFNLGFAIGSFTGLKPGVYLSMNGGIFNSDEVEKNEAIFRFE